MHVYIVYSNGLNIYNNPPPFAGAHSIIHGTNLARSKSAVTIHCRKNDAILSS